MSAARSEAAALLGSGQVLMAGGYSNGTKSAEFFIP
jgi:hypothetical protein